MNKTLSRVTVVAGCLLLTACASKVTANNYKKIKVNMTPAQVQAILGSPDETSGTGFGTLSGLVEVWKHDGTRISVTFANNKMVVKNLSHGKDDD